MPRSLDEHDGNPAKVTEYIDWLKRQPKEWEESVEIKDDQGAGTGTYEKKPHTGKWIEKILMTRRMVICG